jgi:arabinofuranan 3-O-arabinosyltransferase
VVVDQESRDTTRKIAHAYGASVIDIKRTDIYIPPSQSRNVGFSKSGGKYVLHLDSDMELSSPNLLSTCVSVCKLADAVIIPEIDVGNGFWAKCKRMERQCHFGRTMLESPRFFRRDIFQAVSGYNTDITSGEDWDLTDRLVERRAVIDRVAPVIRHHLGELSLESQLMKKFSYGKTMLHYVSRNNGQISRRLSTYVGAYKSNVKTLGLYIYPVLLLRSIEAMGIFAGMALSKVTGDHADSTLGGDILVDY